MFQDTISAQTLSNCMQMIVRYLCTSNVSCGSGEMVSVAINRKFELRIMMAPFLIEMGKVVYSILTPNHCTEENKTETFTVSNGAIQGLDVYYKCAHSSPQRESFGEIHSSGNENV